MFRRMKTQAKLVSKNKGHRKAGAARKPATETSALLPAWVIGCYDGPSDGKLSAKKAYVQ